jgi:ketosteroid isomerase-like protein
VSDPEHDVALVRRALQLVSDLDMDAAVELLTDDVVLELPFRSDGGPRSMCGADARAFFRTLPKLLSRLDFRDVVVHGRLPSGVVVAEYGSSGLTRSGRDYPNTYVGFFTLRGGLIAGWREYFDPNVVAAAFS